MGEEVIGLLVERLGEKLKVGRDKAAVAETRMGGTRVVLAFPTTYMNLSGEAVGAMMRRYKLTEPTQLIVVHDELDLAPGSDEAQVREMCQKLLANPVIESFRIEIADAAGAAGAGGRK